VIERPPIAVGKGRIRPERNCLRKQVCKQCFCMLSKLNAAANLSFIPWEVTLQDMEINIPQSDFMVGFESVHDNSREDRRFRYRTASLCRDRSRDIARLNDEIVALEAIIKVPWMQSWVYIASGCTSTGTGFATWSCVCHLSHIWQLFSLVCFYAKFLARETRARHNA
jgi:hypothetical protein